MITIQILDQLAKALMTVVLVVPHVLVIAYLAVLVEAETDQTVDGLGRVREFGGVFLTEFEDDFVGRVLDDLGGERA